MGREWGCVASRSESKGARVEEEHNAVLGEGTDYAEQKVLAE